MSIIPLKDKIIADRFLKAEEIRNERAKSHIEVVKSKLKPIINLQKNSYVISSLENALKGLHALKLKKNSLKLLKENSDKLQESILLHRKVLKNVIKQQSKIIRKEKKPKPKSDRLPYLAQLKNKAFKKLYEDDQSSEEYVETTKNYKPAINPRFIKSLISKYL
jgi:hypothetical protein